MKERCEIEEKYKWDLTKFCKNNADFYDRLDSLEKKLDEVKQYEGKLKTSDDLLFECLELIGDINEELSTLWRYAALSRCTDNADTTANEMCEKISIFSTKADVATTFLDVELTKFYNKKLDELSANPRFKNYKRMFYAVKRSKRHMLSKQEELLLSNFGTFLGGSSDNFDKFSDVDLKFGEIEDSNGKKYPLNQSNYSVYAESKDRVLRRNAFKRMNGKYGEFINFLANNYILNVKENCTLAKVRKYGSALYAGIFSEEASVKVYKMLIKKVRKNVDILQDFYEVKRRALNLDQIAIYDSFVPICDDLDFKFTYDEAIELIKKAVAPLGEDYVELIDRAKNERWIDVFPNKNKDSGAFETGAYGATPVVLTNFEGNLNSVFTLVHELGHAMHSYYSFQNQPRETSNYVIFVAEVASTTNEMLLLRYLLKNAKSDKERIYYYNYFLTNVRSTIFRQTQFSEFEEFTHSQYELGTPLTCKFLCDLYASLNRDYYGRHVEQLDEMQYEWARIPHFYTPFYVYKYATGLICAINISENLIKGDKTFLEKYKTFLSSGDSEDPISLLRKCDCDLEHGEIYDEVFAYIRKVLKELNSLV